MKISSSKKELARIISENGGWRNGEFVAQDGDGEVGGYSEKPQWSPAEKYWFKGAVSIWFVTGKVANYYQTTLSRAEYFHLYPAPDAKPQFCESVMRSIPGPDEQVWTNPPTIEQLAADYRNAKGYADRKQQEADEAKADADEKLRVLEIAGEALGLLVSPITASHEPESVITDWRDLQVGDEVECVDYDTEHRFGVVRSIDKRAASQWVEVLHPNMDVSWPSNWRFIRRP